ncbi:MAG: extracellular solute-binding protein [Lachnospiraceae bacterium]|nr:extracellular solute-binding protein [Lachnospiraceae bacterium]
MKKGFKRILTVALVGAMAVSMLAGCGKEKKSSGYTGSFTGNINKDVKGVNGWSKFDKQVTLKIPVYQRATPNGAPDAAKNYWTDWVQKEFGDKYNIKVEYVALARGKENELYAQKAAAKDLPVACFEYDYPDVTLYQSEGYFAEYDKEWFAHIAPTYWQAMVDNTLDKYTDINGKTVLIIGTRPYGKTNYQFVTFYRKDWVKAAGYDEYPSDPAELLKMYAKIKSLGLCGDHILGGTKIEGSGVDQNYAYRKYPQDKLLWATTGDYNIPALSTDAQKEFLRWQNKLYNLGYIDDEYNTRTSDYAATDFVSGKTLTYSCYATQNIDVLNEFYKANPNASLGIIVNKGPETYSDGSCSAFRPNGIFGEYIGFSSQATEEEKTAFAMYLEWMSQPDILFTLQWGFEGKNFNYENGVPVSVADQSGIIEQQSHNNNVDMWCLVTATRSLGDVDKDIKAITPQGYKDSEEFFKAIKANYEGQLKCYDAGLASPDCMFTVSIASSDEYKTALSSKYAELRDKIVMGKEADFEKNYAAASEEYLKSGYQEVIDEKKKAFEAGNYN